MLSRPLVVALSLALAACTPAGTVKPPTGSTPKPKAPVATPAVGGGTLISDAGASLVGVVRAPAGIVANHGAGIISNNGGAIVTDNGAGLISDLGGGYRLAQLPAQVPVANALVVLLDAAGTPVRDADGQVVNALTDAKGAYRFPAGTTVPDRNMVAAAKLAGGQGTLLAIVPRGGKQADLELVSTLTTGYILNQYVRGQADPLATLERLPAAVEAETRAKAQAAVDARPQAVPATVTQAAVTGAVEALKAADAAFGAQLETVRKLLIVAGQAELGEGLAATEVLMSLKGVLPLPGGGLYLPSWLDRRVWKVDAAGTLTRVAGRGGAVSLAPAGQPARDVGLGAIHAADVDAQGRLVFADLDATSRLWRVEPDGKLKLLRDFGRDMVTAVACAPDGTAWVLLMRDGIVPAGAEPAMDAGEALVALNADGTQKSAWEKVPLLDALNGMALGDPLFVGPQGQLWAAGRVWEEGGLARVTVAELDPVAQAVAGVAAPAGGQAVAFDRAGTWYLKDAAGALIAVAADGKRSTVLAAPPKDLDLTDLSARPGADGALYLADGALAYRVRDGVATRLAGLPPDAAGVGGAQVSVDPAGLTALPDGSLIVAESQRKRLLKLAPDGTSSVHRAAGLDGPEGVARDGLGGLWIAEGRSIKRLAPDGTLEAVYAEQRDQEAWLTTAWGGPDGTGWWVVSDGKSWEPENPGAVGEAVAWLYKRAPGGAVSQVLAFDDPADERAVRNQALLIDAAGAMHRVRRAGDMVRLEKLVGTAWQAVGKGWPWPAGAEWLEHAAFDAQGRVVYAYPGQIRRGDPATGQDVVLAGPGGRAFAGGAGDDDALGGVAGLAVGPKGDVFFADREARQVRRIPADRL